MHVIAIVLLPHTMHGSLQNNLYTGWHYLTQCLAVFKTACARLFIYLSLTTALLHYFHYTKLLVSPRSSTRHPL